jgi:hypothetical protein
VVCYCRFGGCCLTVCSGGFWFLPVLRFQVVVASGDGKFCCSGSGFGGGVALAAVPATVPAVVWFVHCTQWVFGF